MEDISRRGMQPERGSNRSEGQQIRRSNRLQQQGTQINNTTQQTNNVNNNVNNVNNSNNVNSESNNVNNINDSMIENVTENNSDTHAESSHEGGALANGNADGGISDLNASLAASQINDSDDESGNVSETTASPNSGQHDLNRNAQIPSSIRRRGKDTTQPKPQLGKYLIEISKINKTQNEKDWFNQDQTM